MKLLRLLLLLLASTVALGQITPGQLPPASLPLTGAEQVPMQQGQFTVQAPVTAIGNAALGNFSQITALWTPPCNTANLFLAGNGTCSNPSTPPGGAPFNIQYNNGGSFGGDSNLVWQAGTQNLVVTGQANATANFAESITSPNTANQSWGLAINAGAGGNDKAIQVRKAGGLVDMFTIFGDGHGFLGAAPVAVTPIGLTWDNTGGWLFQKPSITEGTVEIDGAGGSTALFVKPSTTAGANRNGIFILGPSPAQSSDQLLNINITGGNTILNLAGDGSGQIGRNTPSNGLQWNTTGVFTMQGSGTGNNELLINSNQDAPGLYVIGANASGHSSGVRIDAGISSADFTFVVNQENGSPSYMQIFGDGHGFLGPNVSTPLGMGWTANGNFTFNAPSSGIGVTFNGVAGQFAALFNSAGSGTENGVAINAGAANSDISLDVDNKAGTIKSLRVFGDGSITQNNVATQGVGTLNNTGGYFVNSIPATSSFASVAGTTVTTTDTYLSASFAVPANTLAVGNQFEIVIIGQATSSVANSVTFTVRLGTAGTTADASIGTFVLTAATSGSGNGFIVRLYPMFTAIGASGTAVVAGELINTAGAGISTNNTVVSIAGSTTPNTTNNNKLGVSAITAAATTSLSIRSVIIQRLF